MADKVFTGLNITTSNDIFIDRNERSKYFIINIDMIAFIMSLIFNGKC